MELLQNRRYEPTDIIPDYYFREIRMQIDCMVEVCREGEISVYETLNIIHGEIYCSMDYQSELWKKLDNLDNYSDEYVRNYTETEDSLFSRDEVAGLEELSKQWTKSDLEKALEGMEKYNNFLIEAQERVEEISEIADYHKKRKAKIKQQIIWDGLPSYPERTDNVHSEGSKSDIADRHINHLINFFPKFENDFFPLVKMGYLEKTEKGLHWKKAKQALAEYFDSIKPSKMEKMKWYPIENAFGEKNLKNSLSRNGNAFKEKSTDFKEWLKIKNNSKKESDSASE
jgi:hypothetical protein